MIQQFRCLEQKIAGVFEITPFLATDERGYMIKDYSRNIFRDNGISFEPVETLKIFSHKNVLRGLHFQRVKIQAKLVQCISGRIWSAVVDLRHNSNTFGKWISVDIDCENGKELLIPGGCAFGTLAMSDSLISCELDENYYPEYDDGILWNDSVIEVQWPLESLNGNVVVSEKDKQLQSFLSYVDSCKGVII